MLQNTRSAPTALSTEMLPLDPHGFSRNHSPQVQEEIDQLKVPHDSSIDHSKISKITIFIEK